jgi:hypothetical protein
VGYRPCCALKETFLGWHHILMATHHAWLQSGDNQVNASQFTLELDKKEIKEQKTKLICSRALGIAWL